MNERQYAFEGREVIVSLDRPIYAEGGMSVAIRGQVTLVPDDCGGIARLLVSRDGEVMASVPYWQVLGIAACDEPYYCLNDEQDDEQSV